EVVASNASTWRRQMYPATAADAAHRAAPAVSKRRNLALEVLSMPAMGGAMVLRPGTNLTTSSDLRPCRSKVFSVLCTQESGLSETEHSSRSTLLPRFLPNTNQA